MPSTWLARISSSPEPSRSPAAHENMEIAERSTRVPLRPETHPQVRPRPGHSSHRATGHSRTAGSATTGSTMPTAMLLGIAKDLPHLLFDQRPKSAQALAANLIVRSIVTWPSCRDRLPRQSRLALNPAAGLDDRDEGVLHPSTHVPLQPAHSGESRRACRGQAPGHDRGWRRDRSTPPPP